MTEYPLTTNGARHYDIKIRKKVITHCVYSESVSQYLQEIHMGTWNRYEEVMKLYIHQEIRVIYVIPGDMCNGANNIALDVQLNSRLHTAHDGDKVCQNMALPFEILFMIDWSIMNGLNLSQFITSVSVNIVSISILIKGAMKISYIFFKSSRYNWICNPTHVYIYIRLHANRYTMTYKHYDNLIRHIILDSWLGKVETT